MYILDKEKLKNMVNSAITDFNIGSYVADGYGEDYFDDAENKDEILEELEDILKNYDYITDEMIDGLCKKINNIELIVNESVNLSDYRCHYENATLGDRIYLGEEDIKKYLLRKE